MAYRSMTDVAYEYLSKRKRAIEFLKLWEYVNTTLNVPVEKAKSKKVDFYSELMLDNRFASLQGNKWDLRNRRKFDEVYIDPDSILIDDDDDEEIEIEEDSDDFIEKSSEEDE